MTLTTSMAEDLFILDLILGIGCKDADAKNPIFNFGMCCLIFVFHKTFKYHFILYVHTYIYIDVY